MDARLFFNNLHEYKLILPTFFRSIVYRILLHNAVTFETGMPLDAIKMHRKKKILSKPVELFLSVDFKQYT